MKQKFFVKNLEELKKLTAFFLNNFSERQLVLLKGPLGSGKTQLVKFVLELVACDETASSPTFSFLNEYQLQQRSIFHLDLYRIKNEEDLETVGLWDLLFFKKGWVFIEWPEKISDERFWPQDWPCVELELSFAGTLEARNLIFEVKNKI